MEHLPVPCLWPAVRAQPGALSGHRPGAGRHPGPAHGFLLHPRAGQADSPAARALQWGVAAAPGPGSARTPRTAIDGKNDVEGRDVAVRVTSGGRRSIIKTKI